MHLFFFSPSGWVHSVTAQQPMQPIPPPACVEARTWQSRVRAVVTAWNVEPAFATTRSSLKGPTVSMTGPGAQDMEASSATVQKKL